MKNNVEKLKLCVKSIDAHFTLKDINNRLRSIKYIDITHVKLRQLTSFNISLSDLYVEKCLSGDLNTPYFIVENEKYVCDYLRYIRNFDSLSELTEDEYNYVMHQLIIKRLIFNHYIGISHEINKRNSKQNG